ncbi:hypothetical protein RhiXN_12206 [Rhizoctonia solani]|uniref:Transmembrane protein n=1 Tax=Rhizoctonia solani TaxID=456999 RepID=A0A8H8P779_9AGAM|nr:uncharacterized protein RhiXN_12206 [Rhizoctonia solani]QRW26545.1 hypothetical protein RhiXN_12206 [Rhizoctonia solani]
MIAFSRLTTLLLFVLSLGFLTCAAPTTGNGQALSVRGGDCANVVDALASLKTKLEVHLDACDLVKADTDVNVLIIAKVKADVEEATKAVAKIGVIADVDAKIKADIVARIAVIVSLVVKILIKLSAKISSIMADICIQIDVCLKALLVALNVCINGVVALSLKAIVDLTILVFIKVKLSLCAGLLGLLNISVAL